MCVCVCVCVDGGRRTDGGLVGRFRFSHSSTLNSVLARLGLYRDDEPLLADNFARHDARPRRRWSTSHNSPMAGNLAFVKYSCDGAGGGAGAAAAARRDERVATLVNERLVGLPDCAGALLCPLDRLVDAWSPLVDDCDVHRLCREESA